MRSPLDDDSPSGRLLSTMPISSATLTPPCNTVRPSTKDSGIPSRTEPNTMASGEPDACAPSASLRSPAPFRSSSQLPTVKVAAPISVNRPTCATSVCLRASSISSNEIEPIKRPAPSAITTAMSFGLGVATYAISAPTSSAEAATAPHKNASIMAGHRTVGYREAADPWHTTCRLVDPDSVCGTSSSDPNGKAKPWHHEGCVKSARSLSVANAHRDAYDATVEGPRPRPLSRSIRCCWTPSSRCRNFVRGT